MVINPLPRRANAQKNGRIEGLLVDHKSILENRADLGSPEAQDFSDGEELVFALQDRHHQFSLGLTTILQCVRLAEQEGGVPALPEEWWIQVARRYPVTIN